MAWCIKGSKKGELQVFVEKRPKGKKATCIDHVEGDAQSLLTELKDKLGCGGILAPSGAGSRVELQGDHVEAALLFLAERPDRLKGVAGAKKTIEAAAHALAAASAAEILVEEAAERRERRRTSGKARHAKDSWTVETPEAVRQGLMVKLADGGCDLLPWTAKHCCPMDWVYCSSNCRVPNDLGGYDPPANGNVFWDDGARVTLRDDAMDVSAFEDLLMCPSPANDAAEHSRGQQQKNALRRQAKAAVISKRRDISTTAKPTAPKSAPRTAPPPRAWSRPDVTVDDEYGDADDWDEDVSEESEDEDDASAPAGRPARPSRASSQLDADVRRKSMPTVDWATMYSALADAACGAAASSVDWTIADAVLYAGGDLDEAALEAVRAHIEREAHREEKRYDDGVAYTRLEFSEYYGDDSAWLAAPRGMPLQSAPTADRAPAAREASDLARALALSQDDGALDDDDALHDALRASLRASDADADAIGRALALSRLPGGSATATFAPVGESPWGCGACTFANAAAAPECGMCGTARLSEAPTWICGECTFANAEKPSGVSLCDMCGSARQARPAPLPKRPARAAPPPYAAATQRPRPPLAAETPGWPRGAQFQPLVYDDDDDDLVAGGGPTARR